MENNTASFQINAEDCYAERELMAHMITDLIEAFDEVEQ